MGNLVVDSERAGQTLLENDPNSKYPICQVFDLSIESNDMITWEDVISSYSRGIKTDISYSHDPVTSLSWQCTYFFT